MKKIKEYKKKIVGGAMFTLIVFGVASGLIIANTPMGVDKAVMDRSWKAVAADGDPGAGASGMLEIFIYPHDADPGTTYATNLSSASAYASRNTWNGTLTGDVPYDTEFDIVIKVRYNVSHAYNVTAVDWDMDYVKALITSADLSIGADTEMSGVQTATSATYMWVQFYMNNAGSGYTRTHGLTTNVTSVKLQAFY
jgi:hypothetical protein